MNKILIVAAIAAFTMTSCKKDYTCECSGKDVPPAVSKLEYKKVKKGDAEDACESANSTYKIAYGSDASCKLN